MTNEEELKILVETAETNIEAARKKFIDTTKEEYSKLEAFFKEHENEIALPIGCLNTQMSENDYVATKLTRDFKIRGWRGKSFYIQYKNGEQVPLTPELLSQVVFIDDDGKEIADEFRDRGDANKPVTQAYTDLITTGRYAVIICRHDCTEDFKIYIGKIHYKLNYWRDKTRPQMSYNGQLFDIVDNKNYLHDAVTFSNSSDFCEYISKYSLSNGLDVKGNIGWLKHTFGENLMLVRNNLTIQKLGGTNNEEKEN